VKAGTYTSWMDESATNSVTASKGKAGATYRVVVQPAGKRVRVVFAGVTIADSTDAVILYETRLPPVYYFPQKDVRMEYLQRTEHRTHCPFKGNASYWTIEVGNQLADNTVWAYENSLDEAKDIQGYLAFTWSAMEAWYEDEQQVLEQRQDTTPSNLNVFTDWLLSDAWNAASVRELVHQLADCLFAAGVPIWRLQLLIRTLHPQLFATSYTWWRDSGEVETFGAAHDVLETREHKESPYASILDGAGGVRRSIEADRRQFDFPILKDLHARGATDYVAMPLLFSDGQINIITLVSDRSGGFSTNELGQLYEILPVLSRLFEVHALRRTAITLLDTYLGKHAGQRVLEGSIKRGDGENIHAVIWFCDLRDSTSLSESLMREEYLEMLNQFFDCMAGAVLDHGGEVLKFIGDAVLAIFPIEDPDSPEAAGHAIEAAQDAQRRIAVINQQGAVRGAKAIGFGVGMHIGNLMYGNIGTLGRLDFTVIGSAVNEASRIESMCKKLGQTILISDEFARHFPDDLVSLGVHTLRGVSAPQELFTLSPSSH
jgi:adenylate cyclase